MKFFLIGLLALGSVSTYAEEIRSVTYTASRESCAVATTVAVNKCLSGEYWGAVRRGDVRKLDIKVASEKQIEAYLCEVTITCTFRFNK
jgi:hypothetical protein